MKPVFLFLFLMLFTSLISADALGDIDSPRKQMANGVSAEEVICKNGLQLMIRSNGDAICAQLSSVERWIFAQGAVIVDTIIEDSVNNSNSSNKGQIDGHFRD